MAKVTDERIRSWTGRQREAIVCSTILGVKVPAQKEQEHDERDEEKERHRRKEMVDKTHRRCSI